MKQTTAKARLIFWSAIAVLVILAMILCGVYTGTRVVSRGMPMNRTAVEEPEFVVRKEAALEDEFADITLDWKNSEITIPKSGIGIQFPPIPRRRAGSQGAGAVGQNIASGHRKPIFRSRWRRAPTAAGRGAGPAGLPWAAGGCVW